MTTERMKEINAARENVVFAACAWRDAPGSDPDRIIGSGPRMTALRDLAIAVDTMRECRRDLLDELHE